MPVTLKLRIEAARKAAAVRRVLRDEPAGPVRDALRRLLAELLVAAA